MRPALAGCNLPETAQFQFVGSADRLTGRHGDV